MVPLSLRDEVMHWCHDGLLAGHLGQAKTLHQLLQRLIWHGMSKDCTVYVKACPMCNANKKPSVKAKAPLGNIMLVL